MQTMASQSKAANKQNQTKQLNSEKTTARM